MKPDRRLAALASCSCATCSTIFGSMNESSPLVPDKPSLKNEFRSSLGLRRPGLPAGLGLAPNSTEGGMGVCSGLRGSSGGGFGSWSSATPSNSKPVWNEKLGEEAKAGERPWMERVRSGDGAAQKSSSVFDLA